MSDLLIGTFSMPLFTQYLLLSSWPLGPWLCDIWLSLDWTVCLTSQYTVFLITVDRFLSVKIPAKYRNWRTERKVRVMVGVTWVLPAVVFFTSIIGWQYFVGKRTVEPGTCEVQFMSDPLFTFMLTIGYYWITLVVMCVLYGGIYKVALDLQRKSDAKHRKLESTMELAADNSAAKTTASNSSDSDKQKAKYFRRLRQKKKSLQSVSAGERRLNGVESLEMMSQRSVLFHSLSRGQYSALFHCPIENPQVLRCRYFSSNGLESSERSALFPQTISNAVCQYSTLFLCPVKKACAGDLD